VLIRSTEIVRGKLQKFQEKDNISIFRIVIYVMASLHMRVEAAYAENTSLCRRIKFLFIRKWYIVITSCK